MNDGKHMALIGDRLYAQEGILVLKVMPCNLTHRYRTPYTVLPEQVVSVVPYGPV